MLEAAACCSLLLLTCALLMTSSRWQALGYIAPSKLGVGICPQPSSTKKPYGPDPCGPEEWDAAMVEERMLYLQSLMSSADTAFKMMNVCCAGTMSETWWAGMGTFYKALAAADQQPLL